MNKFSHITTWIFDFDETLYPVGNGYLAEIFERFPLHVSQNYNLSIDEVQLKLKSYAKHVHDPAAALKNELGFNQAKWDEDCLKNNRYDLLEYCSKTDSSLVGLSGRKVIFTNASLNQTVTAMEYLKLGHHFSYICANDKRGLRPKPMPEVYEELVETLGVDPKTCAMIEDGAKNLKPAHDLGMTTILVNRPENPNVEYVHHHYKTLLDFLSDSVEK